MQELLEREKFSLIDLKQCDNVNCRSSVGKTLLYIACRDGHSDCVKLLLEHNADPNIVSIENVSPLYMASQNGHSDCVKLLLEHNADPNIVSIENVPPLYIADQNGNSECVKIIRQYQKIHWNNYIKLQEDVIELKSSLEFLSSILHDHFLYKPGGDGASDSIADCVNRI